MLLYIIGLSLSVLSFLFLSFSPAFTLKFLYLSPIVNFTVTVNSTVTVTFSVVYLPIAHLRLPYILTHLLSTTGHRRFLYSLSTRYRPRIVRSRTRTCITSAQTKKPKPLVKELLDRYRYLSRPFGISSSDLPN
jgi:hypothetical protein